MEIAFWSNIGGKGGVTSNLACVSIMLAMEHSCKSILFENHCHMMNLEKALVKNKKISLLKEEESYYYNHIGMDSLMKKMHSNLYSLNMIEKACLSFLSKGIYYIPQTSLANKELFEYELNEVINPLLDHVNQFGQVTIIDTAGSNNLTTKIILSKADLVVVNLCQDPQIINHFFENYSSLKSKSVYLLGNYNHNSKFNLANIRRKYKISEEQMGVIPYNIAYKDALAEGTTISFLSRNIQCKIGDDNFYFIKELKNTTDMIHKKIEEFHSKLSEKAVGA